MSYDSQYPDLLGRTVVDPGGSRIGKVHSVFLHDDTGRPEWVTVITGLLVTQETFVPLKQARARGDELVVVVAKSQVKFAPAIDTDHGHLSPRNERLLYEYYGLASDDNDRARGAAPDAGDDRRSYADARSASQEALRLGPTEIATWY